MLEQSSSGPMGIMADADAPTVAPATDAEIVDSVFGGPDEEEESTDEQPREVQLRYRRRTASAFAA